MLGVVSWLMACKRHPPFFKKPVRCRDSIIAKSRAITSRHACINPAVQPGAG
jgi:hypothetical protein